MPPDCIDLNVVGGKIPDPPSFGGFFFGQFPCLIICLYHSTGCLSRSQLSAYISCCKFPPASQLPALWRKSLTPLMDFLKRSVQGNERSVPGNERSVPGNERSVLGSVQCKVTNLQCQVTNVQCQVTNIQCLVAFSAR